MTIASTVFDLDNAVMHVAAGQPNRSEYQPVYQPATEERKVVRAGQASVYSAVSNLDDTKRRNVRRGHLEISVAVIADY